MVAVLVMVIPFEKSCRIPGVIGVYVEVTVTWINAPGTTQVALRAATGTNEGIGGLAVLSTGGAGRREVGDSNVRIVIGYR